jgi:hypothetical protein
MDDHSAAIISIPTQHEIQEGCLVTDLLVEEKKIM